MCLLHCHGKINIIAEFEPNYFYFHVYVLLACMFVSQVCAQCLRRPEDKVGSPETGIADSRERPYGCWELKMGFFF